MKLPYKQRILEELQQEQAIADTLIQKILYSKRMLVDHVDALEHCMQGSQGSGPNTPRDETDDGHKDKGTSEKKRFLDGDIFTAKNTSLILGASVLDYALAPRYIRPWLIPTLVIAGGFTAMYATKKAFAFRNKMVESELDSLIRSIDDFGNCIRRNMTYFNEIIVMKQQELIESRQIERAWDCITAAKEVTEILYEATRKVETDYPIPAKFSEYYSPMEELKECEYFKNNVTNYSPKHIKDFHNIFAYVQSQFLLRLALTVSTKPPIGPLTADLVKIDCLVRQLVHEEENHFKSLALDQKKKQQLEIDQLNASQAMQNRSGPVAVLQDSSLRLSARMVAVAAECQSLDITLQRLTATEVEQRDNTKHLVEVANNMRCIESALSVCFDDFQRLMLVYNKFLGSKLLEADEAATASEKKMSDGSDEEFAESFLRVEISQGDVSKSDDFYAYMFDERQAKVDEGKAKPPTAEHADLEILNFEKRLTKGKFRPVLAQLKDRIDPIRQVMLEKERQVLAAKGINVDELFRKEENDDDEEKEKEEMQQRKDLNAKDNRQAGGYASDSSGDSEGSADEEFRRRMKKLKEQDNYAEMRNFLAQKPAINIFNLGPTAASSASASAVSAVRLPPAAAAPAGDEDILESEC